MPPDQRTDSAPRICQDPLSGRPVFVAPQRGGKPDDRELSRSLGGVTDDPSSWCPFCVGNESRTPPDIVRSPADTAAAWQARIVPNRYPIAIDRQLTGPSEMVLPGGGHPAHGTHDVVIESPCHDRSILAITPDAWRDVWTICQRRLAMLFEQPDIAWATVFKNSGPGAGASLEHVHSQLVGIDVIPPAMRTELAMLESTSDLFGRLLAEARSAGRIIATAGDLIALVPPAPRQPFETWIIVAEPERHFHTASAARVMAVADLTRDIVGRLERLVPGCDYNWWLHQAPFERSIRAAGGATAWHWHLEILPRLTELAGFELGTGCHITTLPAAEAAERLQAATG
ncbi:MAG: DUF4921 family protein [Planctomycetia bacterium]|nr:DUF4921 family protein [Planctomycetia bacterium]